MSGHISPPQGGAPASDTIPMQTGEIEVNLICPRCEMQNGYSISKMKPIYPFTCPRCRTKFDSRIVKIRDAKSTGGKGERVRNYAVRYQDFSNQESKIEFVNDSRKPDIRLRAKDLAVFSYIKDQLALVQNSTTGQYVKVSDPRCFLATYVYGGESWEVVLLRQFRDDYLLPTRPFALLVRAYYAASPMLLRWFGNYPVFRHVLKVGLQPIVWFLHRITSRRD